MLGDNIRAIRKANKVSINNLAKITGIALGYLSDLENNKAVNPSINILETIASALGVTAIKLIAGDSAAENNYFDTLNTVTAPEVSTESKQAFSHEIDKHTIVKPISGIDTLKKEVKKFMSDQKVIQEDKEALFKYVSDLYWASKQKNS